MVILCDNHLNDHIRYFLACCSRPLADVYLGDDPPPDVNQPLISQSHSVLVPPQSHDDVYNKDKANR
jgi:hypothetical protein